MDNHIEDAKLVLKDNGKSFYWAGKFLPRKYNDRAAELYSFCRILDDIADSGDTILKWRDEMFNPKFATLHYKTSSKAKPEFFAEEIDDDFGWIVYPWEKENSNPIQGYLEE